MKFFSFGKNQARADRGFHLSREQFLFWGVTCLGFTFAAVAAWGSYSFYVLIFSGEMQMVSALKTDLLSEKEIDEVILSIEKREKLFHELLEQE